METVKTLTEAYVEALEKLSGSAVIGVSVSVERLINECAGTDAILGIETSIRTR